MKIKAGLAATMAATLLQWQATTVDTFDRANGALASPWAAVSGFPSNFNISSNAAVVSALGTNDAYYYSSGVWASNQFAWAVLGSPNASGAGVGYGVILRGSNSAATYYGSVCNGSGYEIWKTVAGTKTSLGSATTPTCASGDVLAMTAAGSTLTVYKNWAAFFSTTDSSITGGYPGIRYSSTDSAGASILEFAGGPYGVSTALGGFGVAVNGNHFVSTATGLNIQMRGLNFSGLEDAGGGWNSNQPNVSGFQQVGSAGQQWTKISLARVPVNEGYLIAGIGGLSSGTAATNLATLVSAVNAFTSNGIYVLIDLHWSAPGTNLDSSGQNCMADDTNSNALWTLLANTFKTNPAVMFDLFNEPFIYTPSSGGCNTTATSASNDRSILLNGGAASVYQPGAHSYSWNTLGFQSMINTIRATGATNVIVCGGEAYSDDPTWWTTNPPTDSLSPAQLAVSIHLYPFTVDPYGVGVGTDPTSLLTTIGKPVIVGEFGETDGGSSYMSTFTSWADGNGYSYAAWGWFNSGSPTLVTDITGTPNGTYGSFYRTFLATHL